MNAKQKQNQQIGEAAELPEKAESDGLSGVVDEAARELSEAATEWWLSLRPLDYDEAEHFANPTINCANDSERGVALALVALLRSERDV